MTVSNINDRLRFYIPFGGHYGGCLQWDPCGRYIGSLVGQCGWLYGLWVGELGGSSSLPSPLTSYVSNSSGEDTKFKTTSYTGWVQKTGPPTHDRNSFKS